MLKLKGLHHTLYITPSKMSTPLKLCALPVRTVLFRPICAYCGKSERHYALCDVQLAVLACGDPEHQAWADRDAQAWLGRNGHVRPKQYREDPLFKDTSLLLREIVVPRTRAAQCDDCGGRAAYPWGGGPECGKCAGTPDHQGWAIRKPYSDDAALITFYAAKGVWVVPVGNASEDIIKHIPVSELKLSLPEDKHGLVDAFDSRLKAGFYRAAMRAYEEALLRQKEMEEPSVGALAPRAEDNIVTRFHPQHGAYRVFVPPSVEPSASDPVAPPPLVQLGAV